MVQLCIDSADVTGFHSAGPFLCGDGMQILCSVNPALSWFLCGRTNSFPALTGIRCPDKPIKRISRSLRKPRRSGCALGWRGVGRVCGRRHRPRLGTTERSSGRSEAALRGAGSGRDLLGGLCRHRVLIGWAKGVLVARPVGGGRTGCGGEWEPIRGGQVGCDAGRWGAVTAAAGGLRLFAAGSGPSSSAGSSRYRAAGQPGAHPPLLRHHLTRGTGGAARGGWERWGAGPRPAWSARDVPRAALALGARYQRPEVPRAEQRGSAFPHPGCPGFLFRVCAAAAWHWARRSVCCAAQGLLVQSRGLTSERCGLLLSERSCSTVGPGCPGAVYSSAASRLCSDATPFPLGAALRLLPPAPCDAGHARVSLFLAIKHNHAPPLLTFPIILPRWSSLTALSSLFFCSSCKWCSQFCSALCPCSSAQMICAIVRRLLLQTALWEISDEGFLPGKK